MKKLIWALLIFCPVLLVQRASANEEVPILGAYATVLVLDFPRVGDQATLEWREEAQHFAVVDVRTPEDSTLDGTLFQAVASADADDAVADALAKGASVYARDADGETALFHVTDPEIAAQLIDAGIPLNARNRHGMTALHDHVIWGRIAIVCVLLDAGANPTLRDERGWTALRWVEDPPWNVTQGSPEMIALLREAMDGNLIPCFHYADKTPPQGRSGQRSS